MKPRMIQYMALAYHIKYKKNVQ